MLLLEAISSLFVAVMETLNWLDIAAAGLAIVIFTGGLLMLVSGVWSARDK